MTFAERLAELMQRDGITNYRLSKLAGCSATTVANWLSGKEVTQSYLTKLAEVFHVPTDYLLGAEGAPTAEGELTFDDFTYAMHSESRALTGADKALLLSMAKQLNEARKRKNGETV